MNLYIFAEYRERNEVFSPSRRSNVEYEYFTASNPYSKLIIWPSVRGQGGFVRQKPFRPIISCKRTANMRRIRSVKELYIEENSMYKIQLVFIPLYKVKSNQYNTLRYVFDFL